MESTAYGRAVLYEKVCDGAAVSTVTVCEFVESTQTGSKGSRSGYIVPTTATSCVPATGTCTVGAYIYMYMHMHVYIDDTPCVAYVMEKTTISGITISNKCYPFSTVDGAAQGGSSTGGALPFWVFNCTVRE